MYKRNLSVVRHCVKTTDPYLSIFHHIGPTEQMQVCNLHNITTTTRLQHQKLSYKNIPCHDDVIKWKHFLRYWPFVRAIHRSPVNSPHKGQRRGAFGVFFHLCLNKR